MKKNKINFFAYITMIFVVILIISNISASNTFSVGPFNLSAAEFLFPVSYIIGDLLVELYGGKTTQKIILWGLILTLFSTVFLFLTTFIPSNYTEYNTVFGFISGGVVGITIASFIAYFTGTALNTFVMEKFKQKDKENNSSKKFFKRAILSSVVAEIVDSLVFITFCCIFASSFYQWEHLFSFVLTISGIKLLVELILFPITNFLRKKLLKNGFIQK